MSRRGSPLAGCIELREEIVCPGVKHRVDREQGIIYDVLALGRESVNSHGVKGAEKTEYSFEAMRAALLRYQGLKINIDHPARDKANRERSSYDRFGKLLEARVTEDGIRGNLKYLKSHRMAGPIADAAEDPDLNDCFTLSHNAWGRGELRGVVYYVTELPEVRSVDVVTEGGTCRSLYESEELPIATKTLRQVFEAAAPKLKATFLPLLELDDTYGDMEMGDSGDHKDDLVAAIGKLVQSTDEADHKLAQKILAMLKPAAGEDDASVSEGDEDAEEEDDGTPKKTEEGRRGKSTAQATPLTETRAKAYCRLAGINPDDKANARLLESLQAVANEDAALRLLEWAKERAPAAPGRATAPRSSGPGGGNLSTPKKAPVTDGKSFAAAVLR